MALENSLRRVLVARLTDSVSVAPHEVTVPFAAYGRKPLHLLALSRLMLDPGVLLLRLAWRWQRAPLTLGQLGGQAVQLISPFVIADAPAGKPGLLDPIDKLARTGPAIGVEVAGALLPAMLMLLQQHRQMLADVCGPIQNAV